MIVTDVEQLKIFCYCHENLYQMARSLTSCLIVVMAVRTFCSFPNAIQYNWLKAGLFHLNRPL